MPLYFRHPMYLSTNRSSEDFSPMVQYNYLEIEGPSLGTKETHHLTNFLKMFWKDTICTSRFERYERFYYPHNSLWVHDDFRAEVDATENWCLLCNINVINVLHSRKISVHLSLHRLRCTSSVPSWSLTLFVLLGLEYDKKLSEL